MAKKMKKKRRKNQKLEGEFGYSSFHCKKCDVEFEISWLDIFSLQEVTHGYVGYDLHEDYIACPKCGENTNDTKVEVDEILVLNPDFDPDKDIPF